MFSKVIITDTKRYLFLTFYFSFVLNKTIFSLGPLLAQKDPHIVRWYWRLNIVASTYRSTHECDVSAGGGGGHVQAGLLDAGGAVERARERAHRARHHQELVDLPVRQPVRRRPHQRLQLGAVASVLLACPRQHSRY